MAPASQTFLATQHAAEPAIGPVTDLIQTGPLYWALGFHADELPDIPTIGVWKFDCTKFDDAKLKLQQKEGYRYDLIANLEYADTCPFFCFPG